MKTQKDFKLGFGLMRLPKNPDGSIDIPQTAKMADAFLAAGGTHFDTAYIYDRGDSEKAFRLAVAERYPRDRYTLSSKLCAWQQCSCEAEAKQQFFTSLERTGAGYFDIFFLHALQRNNYRKYDEYHLWDFLREQKEKGLVRHIGFSFHADAELLEELLAAHPEVDVVLMQINYVDWEHPGFVARACYDVAARHGKSIVVMEPLKGGALARPPKRVSQILQAADPQASYVSWALRFVASLDAVDIVLSGMSDLAQMEENLSLMKDFHPLSEKEQEVIRKATQAYAGYGSIACTACHYCTEGCPQDIPIPEIFSVYNQVQLIPAWDHGQRNYDVATHGRGRASDCIACGQCEGACPQHLPIIELLGRCRKMME